MIFASTTPEETFVASFLVSSKLLLCKSVFEGDKKTSYNGKIIN